MRLINVRRLLFVLLLTAAALVAPSIPHANACSCAPYDVRERLPEVDAAFVGRLIAREDPAPVGGLFSSDTRVRYRFSVERPVKGDIPSGTIDVWSSASGASCGLETPIGERAGILLERDGDDRWTSGLCMQADPDVLIRAGQPLPPPEGAPPPAVLVGTTHGPGRMVSLDGLGRVMAYGGGDGIVNDIAFCPGGARVAEAYSPPYNQSSPGPGVAVRTADGLDVVWERLIGADGGPSDATVADVACAERHGGTVLVLAVRHVYTETTARHHALILAITGQKEPDVLWQGDATAGTFTADGRAAYLNGGAEGRDLQFVDLANPAGPETRTLGRLPTGTGSLTIASDGRRLAGVTTYESWSGPSLPPTKAVAVNLGASPPTVAEADLGAYGYYRTALWSGPDRIVFAPTWSGEQPVRIFDADLKPIGSWSRWGSSHATVVGDRLVGLAGAKVVTAPAATGPASEWADLESGVPGAIAAFPGGAEIGSAPSRSTTTSSPPKPAENSGSSSTTTAAPVPEPEAGDPSSTTTSAPPVVEPAPGDQIVALPENSGGGTGGRPLLASGAGVALLAAGVAGLVRRRRKLPKLPPL